MERVPYARDEHRRATGTPVARSFWYGGHICPMRSLASFITILPLVLSAQAWTFTGDTSATWQQALDRYKAMDRDYHGARLMEIGRDDGGQPLHLFVLSDGSGLTPDSIRAAGKNILFINNAIHAGEPDGIDASLLLARALLDSDQLMGLLARTAVCIVPVHNVSGAEQRGSTSRANQNGPQQYGFRGNARNLDLNRDFMKQDSENARALARTLAAWDPDVYFEPHVSDGADHRYLMALLMGRAEKLSPAMRTFQAEVMEPGLHAWMDRKGMPMCPYFETLHQHPAQGMKGFFSSPRYGSGYNALFDRIAIVSEAHVLKPFADRVDATFQLMLATLAVMDQHGPALRTARSQARVQTAQAAAFPLNWELDTTHVVQLPWKGFAARHRPSEVTGLPRLWYDHSAPTDTVIPWYDRWKPAVEEPKPVAYLIPQQWHETIDRLRWSGVPLQVLARDTVLRVEQDSIAGFSDVRSAYEGHYLHRNIQVVRRTRDMRMKAGDVRVPMGYPTDRYVVEALTAAAQDGFFAWNHFDGVLQQKEWFDPYVFEDKAARLLADDAPLRRAFEAERKRDPAFAADGWAQLAWIYRRSPWMEPGYRKHPVLRVPR